MTRRAFLQSYLDARIQDSMVRSLAHLLSRIAVCVLVLAFLASITEVVSDSLYKQSICLTAACIKSTREKFSLTADIASFGVSLLALVATVGGVLVALSSYRLSMSTTTFGNHLAHFSTFQSFLTSEVAKRDRVDAVSVDVYRWYTTMFPASRSGNLRPSEEYIDAVNRVAMLIDDGNMKKTHAKAGAFRYAPHQEAMMAAVAALGLTLHRQPRGSFFEVEGQILSLIHSVNFAFAESNSVKAFAKRLYI